MIQKEYIDPEFKSLLNSHNEKAHFKNLWDRNDPWFEEPNIGRRDSKTAWSGVSKICIGNQAFFLKKQENYFTYSVNPPFRQLMVQKEYFNINQFNSRNIPCLKVVYFGKRNNSLNPFAKSHGILITEALDNYLSLHDIILKHWESEEFEPKKKDIIFKIAALVQKMHQSGLMHRCLYPKHIYIEKNFVDTGIEPLTEPVCRFIDLESARKAPYKSRKQLRDLESLNRRSVGIVRKEKEIFLLNYLNKTKIDHETMDLFKKVQSISR